MIQRAHYHIKGYFHAPSALINNAPALAALLLTVGLFCWPETVFSALTDGFRLAFMRVVPAVFPMMVLSSVIMDSPLAIWLGLGLTPCTRLLGIRERSASTALFLGLLGGFAVLAQCVDQLYRTKRLSRQQAERLLAAGMNAGPTFVILTVGFEMLGSVALGVLLLTALVLGNLGAAALLRLFSSRQKADCCASLPHSVQQGFPRTGSFNNAIQRAVSACVALCGTIAFFSLVCGVARQLLPEAPAGGLCALLEVTNGVLWATETDSPYRAYLVVAVLSWTGISIQQQALALLPSEISLRDFYLSRPVALLLSEILYAAGARLFPQVLAAGAFAFRASRFSLSIWVSFLLMVAAFLYECTPKSTLRAAQKKL